MIYYEEDKRYDGKVRMNLILASASPRRKELLEQLHIPFRVFPSQADEKPARSPRSAGPPPRRWRNEKRRKPQAA